MQRASFENDWRKWLNDGFDPEHSFPGKNRDGAGNRHHVAGAFRR